MSSWPLLPAALALALQAGCAESPDDPFAASCLAPDSICFQTTGAGWSASIFNSACGNLESGSSEVEECPAGGVLNRCTGAIYGTDRTMTFFYYSDFSGNIADHCESKSGTLH